MDSQRFSKVILVCVFSCRHADLEYISSQVASSKAQMVVELLEAANSTYFQPWLKVCKNISEGNKFRSFRKNC